MPSLLRWGFGYDPEQKGLAPINARVETASQKYLFRDAWKNRRCVIPADGWYEWKSEAAGKQPYYFSRIDGHPLFLAGLWTSNSFCLFTTAADGELSSIHDRRPVALDPPQAMEWINYREISSEGLAQQVVPVEAMRFFAVSKTVNNARKDGAELIERI